MSQGSEASEPSTDNDRLDSAVQDRDIGAATELLDRGADPNFIGSSGITLLNFAVWNEDRTMIKLLLERGADVNKKNSGEHGLLNDRGVAPIELVFSQRGWHDRPRNPNEAKGMLRVLIYEGGAIEGLIRDEGGEEEGGVEGFIGRFGEGLAWTNTTPQEIREWVADAAGKRRERVLLARMKAMGKMGGGPRRKRKTLRKRRHRKHKTQRRLRRR